MNRFLISIVMLASLISTNLCAMKSDGEPAAKKTCSASEVFKRYSHYARVSIAQNVETPTAHDADIIKAIKLNLEALPRPYRRYIELEMDTPVNGPDQAIQIIAQCDRENRNFLFDTPLQNNPLITQLPTLCQSYHALGFLEIYGKHFASLCGYYAAHTAKIFATNPNAPAQQLLELLNSREHFERETLIPGKDLILAQREQKTVAEDGFSNLQGDEIEKLLSPDVLGRIIVSGNAASTGYELDVQMVEKSERLVAAFKSHRINHLIYILATENRNHWVTVLVRREDGDRVGLIITDSIGVDRRSTKVIMDIYNMFNLIESGKLLPSVNSSSKHDYQSSYSKEQQDEDAEVLKRLKEQLERPQKDQCLVM